MFTAVAATLAHRLVNHQPLGGLRQPAVFAAAAFFGGTHLVVNQHRHAFDFAQFALHHVQQAAVVQAHRWRQAAFVCVTRQVFGHQRNALHALGGQLLRNHWHGQSAVHRLSACHGHGIVVQNFVGDIDLGGDGCAYGHGTRMKIGAVAQVLKHMIQFGKSRLTDPGRALTTHVRGQFVGLRKDGRCHHMTAYSCQRQAAFGHAGRSVVRTTRAVIRRARRCRHRAAQHQ